MTSILNKPGPISQRAKIDLKCVSFCTAFSKEWCHNTNSYGNSTSMNQAHWSLAAEGDKTYDL